MIVTFYSFKGGVGRSMALVNVAEILADRGYNVVVCDWDLEAPGLERYLVASELENHPYEQELAQYVAKPGLMDLLLEYKESVSRSSQTTEAVIDADRYARLGPVMVRRPSSYTFDVSTHMNRRGRLLLLTAGKRDGDAYDRYAESVRSFDWSDFYDRWAGDAYLDFFREDLVGRSGTNVLLIDSRTGVTEQGGVCTHHLADLVVLLSAANDLNLEGCRRMARALSNPKLVALRGNRRLKILPVASRIEQQSQKVEVDTFRSDFIASFGQYLLNTLGDPLKFEIDTEIKYMPFYSFKERVVAREPVGRREEFLYNAYQRIADAIVAYGRDLNLLATLDTTSAAAAITVTTPAPSRGVLSRLPLVVTYSSRDRSLAEQISAGLKTAGTDVWIQPVSITDPSTPFEEQLEQRFNKSGGYVILALQRDHDAWKRADFDYARRVRAIRPDFRIAVVTTSSQAVAYANYAPVVVAREDGRPIEGEEARGISDRVLTALLVNPPLQAPETACPYPGATPFREEQASYFFGRDDDIIRLLNSAKNQTMRWWNITGATGCGKSSLARAGLIPAVVRGLAGRGERAWAVWTITPSGNPIDSLATAVAGDDRALQAELGTLFYKDGRSLRDHLQRIAAPKESASGFILLLDDLDRLTWLGEPQRNSWRPALDKLLAAAVEDPDLPLFLVTTIRDDSAARFVECFPVLAALLGRDGQSYLLKPLAPDAVRQIIELPARMAGLSFEAGLADRIAADCRESSSTPAIIMRMMQSLWSMRRGRFLTHDAYRQLGGIEGVLVSAADRALHTAPPFVLPAGILESASGTSIADDDHRRNRQLLLRLVSHDGRRIEVNKGDVLAAAGGELMAELALAAFTAAPPLVIVGEDRARLADARLPAIWPTLRQMVDAEKAQLTIRDALESAAEAWNLAGNPVRALPTGEQLAWFTSAQNVAVNESAQRFLAAARVRQAEELKEREHYAAVERELESAKKELELTSADAKSQRFGRRRAERAARLGWAAMYIVLAAIASLFAFQQAIRSNWYQARLARNDAVEIVGKMDEAESPDSWVRALVLTGRADEAAALVRSRYKQGGEALARGLNNIGRIQVDPREPDLIRYSTREPSPVGFNAELINEAAAVAQTIKSPEQRAMLLRDLAVTAADGKSDSAAKLAGSAIDAFSEIGDELRQVDFLIDVARIHVTGSGAESLAKRVSNELFRQPLSVRMLLDGFPEMFAWFQKLNMEEDAQTTKMHALSEISHVPSPELQADFLTRLALAQTMQDERDRLLDMASQRFSAVKDFSPRGFEFNPIQDLLDNHLTKEARGFLDLTGSSAYRRLVPPEWWARAGNFDRALTSARELDDPKSRLSTLLNIAREMLNDSNVPRERVVSTAVEALGFAKDQGDVVAPVVRRQIAVIFAAAGEASRAESLAAEIMDKEEQSRAYIALANNADAPDRLLALALASAHDITKSETRDELTADISILQADLRRYGQARLTAAEVRPAQRLRVDSEIVTARSAEGYSPLQRFMDQQRKARVRKEIY